MFYYEIPSKVIFGQGISNNIGIISKDLGAKNVLLVYDQGVNNAGIVDPIYQALRNQKLEVNVFDKVLPNPTDAMLNEAVEAAKNFPIDMIVAVGGGSSLDTAKAINVLLTNEGPIEKYQGLGKVCCKTLPLIAIPTTAGTASEVTTFTIITDTKRGKKMIVGGQNVGATIALVDPNLTLNLPPSITAATGMDALTHSIEAYVSKLASTFTDINALKAIELIYNNLQTCVKDGKNIEAREKVAMGSVLAGFAFNSAVLGLAHGIAHPLGAHFNIPHGTANAIVLPYVIEFNGKEVPDKIRDIGRAMGLKVEEISVELVVNKIKELNDNINIPRLRDVGIKESDFDLIANATLQESSLGTNPRAVEFGDVVEILQKAF